MPENISPPPGNPSDAPDASPEDIEKLLDTEPGVLDHSEDMVPTPRLAEIEGGDIAGDEKEQDIIRREKERRQEYFYSDLIHAISSLRYPEKEARTVWTNLLNHKVEMSRKMGRNVGIHVAALDFFRNVIDELDQVHTEVGIPVIVGSNVLLSTARLAVTDGLTGLFNHRYFQDRLERELHQAADAGDNVSLLMMDIDYFKVYNDLNGHIAGDVALREVAKIIQQHVKEQDVVARYGGEEFTIIMYGVPKEEAAAAAERVRKGVEDAGFPNEEVLPDGDLTISVGVAEFPQDAHDRTGLITYADHALYVAKRSGRNRVCAVVGDRRMTQRIPYGHPVQWRMLPDDGEAHTFYCRDISFEGMGVSGEDIPKPGKVVRIFLPGAEDDPVHGRIMWRAGNVRPRAEKPGNGMVAGVKFVALDSRQERSLREVIAP